MHDDAELLRTFAETRSEAAFGELVRRHLDLVYFAALRRAGGDGHAAADIAQQVFTTLAAEAGTLSRHPTLVGWLHTATRFAASRVRRDAQRRRAREQEAAVLMPPPDDAEPDWTSIRPALDEVVDELSSSDREAVLLRFFENRPFAEIGVVLRLSENAARMRVERALEKLRDRLERRGITSTAAALGTLLATQAGAAAPAGLGASITSAAVAGVVGSGGGAIAAAKALGFMSTTKLVAGATTLVAVAVTAIAWRQQQANTDLRSQVVALRQETGEIAALREENRRLAAEKKTDDDSVRAEHAELVQLRAARDAFRKQQQAAADDARARAASGKVTRATGVPTTEGLVSVDLLAKKSGQDTPAESARTLLWYLTGGDIKQAATLLTIEPADRQRLEAAIAVLPANIRDEYGTPERLIAFAMAGTPQPIESVQLLDEHQPDGDTTVQHVKLQFKGGVTREDEIKFRHEAEGWKQVVSPTTVDRVIKFLAPRS